jgi:hypothetical protein
MSAYFCLLLCSPFTPLQQGVSRATVATCLARLLHTSSTWLHLNPIMIFSTIQPWTVSFPTSGYCPSPICWDPEGVRAVEFASILEPREATIGRRRIKRLTSERRDSAFLGCVYHVWTRFYDHKGP